MPQPAVTEFVPDLRRKL